MASQSAILLQNKHQRIMHKMRKQSKSEPQKADDANSEQESTKQSEQTTKASSSSDERHISPQSEQTTKASSSTDRTPPGRVGTVIVKVVSSNQIDLKWTGVKDSDLSHYNVYMGTKSSFKVISWCNCAYWNIYYKFVF